MRGHHQAAVEQIRVERRPERHDRDDAVDICGQCPIPAAVGGAREQVAAWQHLEQSRVVAVAADVDTHMVTGDTDTTFAWRRDRHLGAVVESHAHLSAVVRHHQSAMPGSRVAHH